MPYLTLDLIQRIYALSAVITFAILIYANRKNLSYLNLPKLACDAVFWPVLLLEKCHSFSLRKTKVAIRFEDIQYD